MKNFIQYLILCFITFNSFAQIIIDDTSELPSPKHHLNLNSLPIQTPSNPYDALTPYVINVYFTIISDDGGYNSLNNANNSILSTAQAKEAKFMECLKYLNTAFNPHNIFFKYKGYHDVINHLISAGTWNLQLYPYTVPLVQYPHDINFYKKYDCINLIFSDGLNENVQERYILGFNVSLFHLPVLNSPFLKSVIVHKMGHNLGLYHTYEAVSHYYDNDPLFNITQCEHITRINDASHPEFNADIAGDEIVDTPAQPIVQDNFFINNCDDYIFDTTRVNCINEPYENIINGNFMNYIGYSAVGYTASNCNQNFTLGQAKKMREFIVNDVYTGYTQDPYFNGSIVITRNTVESLYEPFKRTILPGNIVKTTDNGNGTAKVCRSWVIEDKFQEGFTYHFPESSAPDTIDANINEIPVEHYGYDYPLIIDELSSGQTNLLTNLGTVTLSCTKGVICNDEPYTGGILISDPNFMSTNPTIEVINALKASDPDLYEKLLSNYYYKLKRETETGGKTEETFYKQ